MRSFMFIIALVLAFQAGRLMPARTAGWIYARAGTAYAQTPPDAGEAGAFADQVAYETLTQLEARAPAISDALRQQMAELTGVVQARLGPDMEQLQAQVAASQSILARSQALLDRTDKTINRSEDLTDDTRDALDDTEDSLDESEDLLDDTDNTLDESDEMLEETKKSLQRSQDLLEQAQALTNEAQDLAERFAEDIDDLRAIVDRLPGPR